MSAVGSFFRSIVTNGSLRALIVLVLFLFIWSTYQMGGLNVSLVKSWLILSLPLVVASIGVTLLIITKQFDLSAAGVMTLINVLVATQSANVNVWLFMVLMVATGALIGFINGMFVVFGKLPAIAVTLATLIILNGFSLVLLVRPGGSVPRDLIDLVTGDFFIPRPVLILVVIVLLWLAFKRTKLGIYMFAVGQDEEALRLSGISVRKVRLSIFTISGGLYAVAGLLLSAAIQSGDATIGGAYLLQTFAAIAIGGTAFVGGSGSAIGTLLGALTLTVIPKMLFVLGISNWSQTIFTGVLIIAAVLIGAVTVKSKREKITDVAGVAEQPATNSDLQSQGR